MQVLFHEMMGICSLEMAETALEKLKLVGNEQVVHRLKRTHV